MFLAPALLLFWRSHANLGRNWSPSLQLREGHALVTRNTYRHIYRHIRHPIYESQWLWNIAQALLLRNWITGPDARPKASGLATASSREGGL